MLLIIAAIWTSISFYLYYTGPTFKIDTYMKYLTQKEYAKIYDLLDIDTDLSKYSKDAIIAYYTKIYNTENTLIKVNRTSKITFKNDGTSKVNNEAFCNIKYVHTAGEKVFPLYLKKEKDKWMIKFPFLFSEVAIHAPMGSQVYINDKKVTEYRDDKYIENNVLPGKYTVKIEFHNEIYSTYNQVINVPEEKEVFLPYHTFSVEIETAKNMLVQLQDVELYSTDGKVTFNNIVEGNYKLKVSSPNHYIEPIETYIQVSKDERLFGVEDIRLSQGGKEKFDEFIKGFYNAYLQDIKAQKYASIQEYVHDETKEHFISQFKAWFIDHKAIQEASVEVQQDHVEIDKLGFLHADLLETIEITNKELDEFENQEIEREYKIILEWHTVVDLSSPKWVITDRTIRESLVSYKDLDGRWVQY